MQQSAETCKYSGEEIIVAVGARGEADPQRTYLTPSSVSQVQRDWGYEKFVSIPLTQLCDVSYQRSKPVLYGLFAALFLITCAILGVAAARGYGDSSLLLSLSGVFGVVAVISFIMYITRRTQMMILSSTTAKIQADLRGTSEEALRGFTVHLYQQMRTMSSRDH